MPNSGDGPPPAGPGRARALRRARVIRRWRRTRRPPPEPAGRRASARRPRTSTTARTSTPAASRAGSTGRRTWSPLGLLVYFHGGGWVLGSIAGSDNLARALANRSGVAVLSVDYRLAPEHPFPAALEDALTATRWAYDHAEELGADRDRLAVGGDSRRRQPGRGGGPARAGPAALPAAPLPGHRPAGRHGQLRGARDRLLPDRVRDVLVRRPLPVGRAGRRGRRPGVTPPRRRRDGAPSPRRPSS